MILPIIAYGHPVLRKVAKEVDKDHPMLEKLISDMKETMYNASGVGLAAPQIGKSIRLFVVDAAPFAEDDSLSDKEKEFLRSYQRVFINARIKKEEGKEWGFKEGCLSIPDINENVFRQEKITITYRDENFHEHTEVLTGLAARVVQHEYDHIEGILFTDKINTLTRRLIAGKLKNIAKGKVKANYTMRFAIK